MEEKSLKNIVFRHEKLLFHKSKRDYFSILVKKMEGSLKLYTKCPGDQFEGKWVFRKDGNSWSIGNSAKNRKWWQTIIKMLAKLHYSVPAAFWEEKFLWRKRNFCMFLEFCGKKSRTARQNLLLLTVGIFRESMFAGKTKKFFINVFFIWTGTHHTFDEIKIARAEVVRLQTCTSKIRPEDWKRMIFFLSKSK